MAAYSAHALINRRSRRSHSLGAPLAAVCVKDIAAAAAAANAGLTDGGDTETRTVLSQALHTKVSFAFCPPLFFSYDVAARGVQKRKPGKRDSQYADGAAAAPTAGAVLQVVPREVLQAACQSTISTV